MMKRGSEIIGLPVICLDEGCKTMEIKDFLFSQTEYRLLAFIVEEGKYFHERKVVRFENVKNIGEDAVIIQNQRCIEKIRETYIIYDTPCMSEKLLGVEIVTEDGTNVGLVQDIMIDLLTGRFTGLVITEGLLDDLIEGRPILPIQQNINLSQDTLILSEAMSQSIVHNTGGLKKILSME